MTTATAPTTGTEVMRAFLPESPFVGHLGIELVEIGTASARLRLPYRAEVATMGTVVHGGALASLIDTTAMVAAWSDAELPDQLRGATVSMSVSYLAPADGEDVEATGTVTRQGRRLVHVSVEAATASGTTVATALVTYQIG